MNGFEILAASDFPHPIWWRGDNFQQRQLIGLEMIIHNCFAFHRACADLSDAAEWLSRIDPPNRLLTADDADFVTLPIKEAMSTLSALDVTEGAFWSDVKEVEDHVCSLSGGIWKGIFEVRADELARDYRRIRRGISEEISRHKFAYVVPGRSAYFEQEKLFGESVYQQFPSARTDIKAAANALALEMYTASVFHLMRSAEIALRALSHDRRVSRLPKKRDAPIEMGTWEEILRELEDQTSKISNWPNKLGAAKSQAQEFYGAAISEIRGLKDTWRNHVMHARREYLEPEAQAVMEHVKRLMVTLSARISESDRTPRVWGKAQIK